MEKTAPEAQIKAGQELVAYLRKKYPGVKVGTHQDYDSTACPGRYFPYERIVDGTAAETAAREEREVCVVELPVLYQGDNSGYVKTMQILLNKYYDAQLDEDGIFGSGTYDAVRDYQESRGLGVDGIVGSQTWAQLLK